MAHPKGLPQVTTWMLPFNRFRKPQRSSGESLHLPLKAPACFDSQEQWREYHTLATISGSKEFNFCQDCTPEHRDQMRAERRCKYPGTTFELQGEGTDDEELIGVRGA